MFALTTYIIIYDHPTLYSCIGGANPTHKEQPMYGDELNGQSAPYASHIASRISAASGLDCSKIHHVPPPQNIVHCKLSASPMEPCQ